MTQWFAKFKRGDLVRVRLGRHATVWTVVEEDTGRTPGLDSQPVYRLRRQVGNYLKDRYVYESELRMVQEQ